MSAQTRSVWAAAFATLLVGGIIGASLMGLYVHRRLSALLPGKEFTEDDLYLRTLGRTFNLNDTELAEIRKDLQIEAPLRTLALLEVLPVMNAPTHVTMKAIEDRIPPEKRNDFLKVVAESMKRKRPRAMADLYARLLLTSDQYREIEKVHSEEIKKGDLPTRNIEDAAMALIMRSKDAAFALLSPEQQRQYEEFLASQR